MLRFPSSILSRSDCRIRTARPMRDAGNWPVRMRRDTVRSDTRRYRAASDLVSRSPVVTAGACGVAKDSGFVYTHDGRSTQLMLVEAAGPRDGFLVFLSNIRECRTCAISGHRHNRWIVSRGFATSYSHYQDRAPDSRSLIKQLCSAFNLVIRITSNCQIAQAVHRL